MCHFYRYGPSLSDDVLHIMNFGAPIVYCIGLETWFMLISHLNMTDFVFFSPQKSLYSEFGSREFQFLKAPSPCAIFIGTGHLFLMVYCILPILMSH